MDYLFENLSDERFQELSQAIINLNFSDTQSFPVGMPDGGRDGVVYMQNNLRREVIVLQIKFVRNPYQIAEPHKWLTDVIEGEMPKINKLIPRGALRYYIITNVRGTSHLDAGSIDKVNTILKEKLSIPAICWWRDDLCRQLESHPLLKWSYPELLNGQDVLNSILFRNIQENAEKRESVIRAYLADQYEMDNEVKFKQIDLQNRLFDLFTDVPIKIKKISEKDNNTLRIIEHITQRRQRDYIESDEIHDIDEFRANYHIHRTYIRNEDFFELDEIRRPILNTAASFLLNSKVQSSLERILIEGGPGQGKSTISQYICQVHRARLLEKVEDLELIPEIHLKSPLKIPIKIDLREVAEWVENKNPYPGTNDEMFQRNWHNSLESFIIFHISYHSKFPDFTVSDFISICKNSSILIVFDGFDEIANIRIRESVIDFINRGFSRISTNAKSLQILITSRPAAFSNTVGFSIEQYPHFELADVTPEITKIYVDKWIKSRKLTGREASELRRLVDEKLKLPHLKELAKSPMQLAIFINLLNTRGESLPNKRTALYDSYIDLFFNRESEKNITIRDKRDLIIAIHEYLAWVLHSEAELFKNSGRIEITKLIGRLKEYLGKEGHDTAIAEQLFDVLKERVCALVSRIQGTFEFEVQPLREYFCAKYLYKTAPYSPAGDVKNGTKPDRFDAIAKNFYWQNVVRFFAGCFDKGELSMLIQKLHELKESEILRHTNYPQLITAQILSDYVFSQYPNLMKNVVSIILEGINKGNIFNYGRTNNEQLIIPNECGRKELISECFKLIEQFPHYDTSMGLINIINNNEYQKVEKWSNYAENLIGSHLVKWIEYAYRLQILHLIDERHLKVFNNVDDYDKRRLVELIFEGNQIEHFEKNSEVKDFAFQNILACKLTVPINRQKKYSLYLLSFFHNANIFTTILTEDHIGLGNILGQIFSKSIRTRPKSDLLKEEIFNFPLADKMDIQVSDFIKNITPLLDMNSHEWGDKLMPWEVLVQSSIQAFGMSLSAKILTVISAGIKSKDEKCEEFDDFNNDTHSLCRRVRHARLKSGNIKWWRIQIDNSKDKLFCYLVLMIWGTPKTLKEFLIELSNYVESLDSTEYETLLTSFIALSSISKFGQNQSSVIELQASLKEDGIIDKLKHLLSYRFEGDNRNKFIYSSIKDYNGPNQHILESKLLCLIELFSESPDDPHLLSQIKSTYKLLRKYDDEQMFYHRGYPMDEDSIKMNIDLAKDVMNEFKDYPRLISAMAEKTCRMYANQNIIPVGTIANEEKWFVDDFNIASK